MQISQSSGALCMMLWVLGVGVNEVSSFPNNLLRNKLVLLISKYLISQFKSNCSQAGTVFLARRWGLGEQPLGKSVLLTAAWECTLQSCAKSPPYHHCSYPLSFMSFISSLIFSLWLNLSTNWCQLLSGSLQDLNSNHMSDPLDSKEGGLRTVPFIARRRRRLPSKRHDTQIKMGGREWDWR